MAKQTSSCQYLPTDQQKLGIPLIYGENVSHVFEAKEQVTAVDHVAFGIAERNITAIIGESGSGKSTLLKLIYGLLEPSSGEIRYRGWLVPTRKDKLIPGHDAMKLVSQGFDDLNLYAKVWDNIASQLPNTNLERKASRTQETLQKLKIDHLAQQRVADLSGGEKQRVAIARALINEPEVLLMDEPFNQVDAAFRDALQQDIRHIVDETGLTILLVSHDPTEVLALADELIVMKGAKIIEQGPPQQLYYEPAHSYTAQLLAKSNILSVDQASSLGINVSSPIAIHQEDIAFEEHPQGTFSVTDIRFRGFYKELVLADGQLSLHAIQHPSKNLRIGDKVNISIRRHIVFD
ncbi:ABC-type Fe3+/spermidine/putrescine transport system ATPase subunit [Sphingobacterium allocomposti]|uniref:ABC-type Fe3+/spermidine/putrescine transport system ATPase subunit n=1 Tax=Sphingobacterium allocomposti TaxID=415956 RepID=A0A5S5D3Q5_9SPHI|nr:ABC transporter ATP-binding protein [Sphingobacterium composti Yoo et al. 2007 non Ten et al. 2007]TYP90024.1 ABC-type Fe3+/spermidine/putrescine transport system ATPase subunit [Sphingobacterium composti Yoo et al. 2007 non Ten et al. 2007]